MLNIKQRHGWLRWVAAWILAAACAPEAGAGVFWHCCRNPVCPPYDSENYGFYPTFWRLWPPGGPDCQGWHAPGPPMPVLPASLPVPTARACIPAAPVSVAPVSVPKPTVDTSEASVVHIPEEPAAPPSPGPKASPREAVLPASATIPGGQREHGFFLTAPVQGLGARNPNLATNGYWGIVTDFPDFSQTCVRR